MSSSTAASRTERRGGGALWPVRAAAGAALLLLLAPLLALLLRVPWRRFPTIAFSPDIVAALQLSLGTALSATALAVVLGVPLAWLLARSGPRVAVPLRVAVTLPLVLPPVIGGIALLSLFGRRGVLGAPLHDWTGFSLPFTPAAVVLAQLFVSLPFLVLTVEGALSGFDVRHEQAAATLGCNRWQAFAYVTLPSLAPAVIAGAALSFARALGEFGATITFAGSLAGRTQTLPTAAYLALQSDPDAALVVATLLLGVCLATVLLLRGAWMPRG